jgi:hypothetical protein
MVVVPVALAAGTPFWVAGAVKPFFFASLAAFCCALAWAF